MTANTAEDKLFNLFSKLPWIHSKDGTGATIKRRDKSGLSSEEMRFVSYLICIVHGGIRDRSYSPPEALLSRY